MVSPPSRCDVIVVGAGPAGASAASWGVQSGLAVTLVDRAGQVCAGLARYDFAQDWLLGQPGHTLAAIGKDCARHLVQLADRHPDRLSLRLGQAPTSLRRDDAGLWQLGLGERHLSAPALVIATGLRPRRPAAFFGPGDPRVLDANGLTAARDRLAPRSRVLLLGGGDNAAENAAYLAERGHTVTVACRAWRAQPALLARVQAQAGVEQILTPVLPRLVEPGARAAVALVDAESAHDAQGPGDVEPAAAIDAPACAGQAAGAGLAAAHSPELRLRFADGSERGFDVLAVLFGFAPERSVHDLALAALDAQGHGGAGVSAQAQALAEVPEAGLYVAGDASARWHPCVQTALADGVRVAKAVLAGRAGDHDAAPRPHRRLRLDGLELQASVGWLDHEHLARQPIRVDTELNLHPRALPDDDLAHVLDYRQVRKLIVDTCGDGHTRLLETLCERLTQRLMRLPGVLGARVTITKLEIFDDCHVAITSELGAW